MPKDMSEQLQQQVLEAASNKTALHICGGGSKDFYGRQTHGEPLNTVEHQGVLNYEPTELVISARAGTRLSDIEKTLAENNQMLAFEPPSFGDSATLGGTIACNLSGPRRAYCGAARDFVLGTRVLNGKGEILRFGGEVMKNVAGYDVSRLMTGAFGTLGVLLEVSLKVLPRAETEVTLQHQLDFSQAQQKIHQWSRQSLPITASCFYDGQLYIRLSGTGKATQSATQSIGGEVLAEAEVFWQAVKQQQHDFFQPGQPLWRLSLASNAPQLALPGSTFYEWGGALRWLRSDASAADIFAAAQQQDGHATLFRSSTPQDQVFQPLPDYLMRLHGNLKQAFDPLGIFNPGRMYKNL